VVAWRGQEIVAVMECCPSWTVESRAEERGCSTAPAIVVVAHCSSSWLVERVAVVVADGPMQEIVVGVRWWFPSSCREDCPSQLAQAERRESTARVCQAVTLKNLDPVVVVGVVAVLVAALIVVAVLVVTLVVVVVLVALVEMIVGKVSVALVV